MWRRIGPFSLQDYDPPTICFFLLCLSFLCLCFRHVHGVGQGWGNLQKKNPGGGELSFQLYNKSLQGWGDDSTLDQRESQFDPDTTWSPSIEFLTSPSGAQIKPNKVITNLLQHPCVILQFKTQVKVPAELSVMEVGEKSAPSCDSQTQLGDCRIRPMFPLGPHVEVTFPPCFWN